MKRMNRMLNALIVAGGLSLALGGCTVYQTAPGVYAPYPPNTFDQSWSAALGALGDEGVQIVNEDRAAGYARGTRGAITVTALVRTQADGSVRVEFKTSGNTDADPSLNDRVTNSYNRRMGR
jgi:hypothetical protein